jgi:putative membrane-bound dehydrogenase-like protein
LPSVHFPIVHRLLPAGAVGWCLLAAQAEVPLPQVERLKTSPVLRHLKANPKPADDSPAAATLSQMHVPHGFRVTLVASEPEVRQPIAFAIDPRGRIWVAEAYSYPSRRPEGEGRDRLVILEDTDADGRFETHKVFAEGLNLVSGFEVGLGGAWVGAAPELLFLPDKDGDDVADGPTQVLLDGFGYQDTHECLNSFHWGPDGWLYGIQGVFNYARIGRPGAPDDQRHELRAGVWRYHPVRHEFEIFAHGGSNPWGLDHDERGQLFMTHCRSYWGRGGTTHVIQGGHFWNQANANHAPFIVGMPPADFPEYRNYLLASARYDHGAGGAGKPGTDAIYGGHSHVGTMIYLGDNWPDMFRGRLFTHNLHGHQINQQVNRRWGSGFDTVHAGRDQFFCSDPLYVAVDLQYGPDGAVYMIDWYDQQHCHNPNIERWDRGNGRVYRMEYEATYRPVRVDLSSASDADLVNCLDHKNAWYARTARRLLQERAQSRPIAGPAIAAIQQLGEHPSAMMRLRALWATHAIGLLSDAAALRALMDPDEYLRAWAIQLCADDREVSQDLCRRLTQLAQSDPSPVVRLYLASAAQRLPRETAWDILEALAAHGEDLEDRNIPFLLWQGLAQLLPSDPNRAFDLAGRTLLPQIADWIHWYAATLDDAPFHRAVAALGTVDPGALHRRLAGLWLAVQPRANVPMPTAWRELAPRFLDHKDERVRRIAELLAAAFGDDSMLPRLRRILADREAQLDARQHALAVLSRAHDKASVPILLKLLDEDRFRTRALNLLARFDSPEIPPAIIGRFESLNPQDRAAALNALTRKPEFAIVLLDAVQNGAFKRDHLTAFHVRQLTELKDPEINRRLEKSWGRIQGSPAEKEAAIAKLESIFNEAPLWAYDARAGREHFVQLCATCHLLKSDGTRIGPELTGAGRNGIRYYLENIIDPNAVVGADFQLSTFETRAGDVISGLKLSETSSAVTLRTITDEQVIPKSDIVDQSTSQLSLMPEGLIESLGPREQIELLKYLAEN